VILVDTSVWVRFFKGLEEASFVADKIRDNTAGLHPLVLGELLLGGLSDQNGALLQALIPIPAHAPERIHRFIRERSLAGKGIGWVDAAILCSASGATTVLATFDEALRSCAETIGVPCLQI
jgi:predicted nucleic acid-binding protein